MNTGDESNASCGAHLESLRALWWDDGLAYIDQRSLPLELVQARAADVQAVTEAIVTSAVGGARCTDAFAGFGAALARRQARSNADVDEAMARLRAAAALHGHVCTAIERVLATSRAAALDEAMAIVEENAAIDRSIAEHAQALLPAQGAVMTLGSSGALSTAGYGTALGAIIAAHRSGKELHAHVSETRPLLTGMRLAAFELSLAGVACTVFPDGAAAALMHALPMAAVIVSASAIGMRGDTVGEIGTYALALAAAHHRVPFYVTVPRATVDRSTPNAGILTLVHITRGAQTAPLAPGCVRPEQAVHTELYDVTPGHLIAAIITEYGISRPPYDESLEILASRPRFDWVNRQRPMHRVNGL